jgi:acyl-coenzyme A synthetase/AMP-(fatty) acid ligase
MELDILRIHDLVDSMQRYSVTHLYTVPSLYYLFSKVPGIEHLTRSIHEFYSGGTQLSPFIFNSFYKKSGRKIREGYGLTESSPGVALDFEEEEPVVNSIGKPMPGCNIRILDEDGRECFPESIGEICIQETWF